METRKAALHVGAICLKVAVFVMIVLGIVYLGQTAYRYSHAVFSEEAFEKAPGTLMRVTIPEDVSSAHLAEVLEEKGIIADATVFRLQMLINGFDDTVKAGTYELRTSMTSSEIIAVLSGEGVEETP